MTITHAEFLRSLLPLKRHYQIETSGDPPCILIVDGSGRARSGRDRSGCDQSGCDQSGCVRLRQVRIDLGPQASRQLGSLQLPTIEVKLSLQGFSRIELDLFWTRFDLSFRRGGG